MRFNTKEPAMAEIDMTPMIDIVFQLIAFFMLITNFEQTRIDERVKLPFDRLAQPPDAAEKDVLILNVGFIRDKDGNKTSDLLVFYSPSEAYSIKDEALKNKIGLEASVWKGQGKNIAEIPVILRPDGEAEWGEIQELEALVKGEGFVKFALGAKQPVGSEGQ